MEKIVADKIEDLINCLGVEFPELDLPSEEDPHNSICETIEAPTFEIQIDRQAFTLKPEKEEAPAIRGRIERGKTSFTVAKLAHHVEHGCSFA